MTSESGAQPLHDRDLTKADLQSFDAAAWTAWLDEGLTKWVRPASYNDKAWAFDPISISDFDRGAEELAENLLYIRGDALLALKKSIGFAIASADPANGEAAFALKLAAFVGCSGFEAALRGLLAKEITADDREALALASAAVLALTNRAPEHGFSLGVSFAKRGLLPAGPATELVAFLAVREPEKIDTFVRVLQPGLFDLDAGSDMGVFLVDQLIDKSDKPRLLEYVSSYSGTRMWTLLKDEIYLRNGIAASHRSLDFIDWGNAQFVMHWESQHRFDKDEDWCNPFDEPNESYRFH